MTTDAPVMLSRIKCYCEGSTTLAASLQATVKSLSRCNLYSSFKKHPNFLSHFDLIDLYIFQIEVKKIGKAKLISKTHAKA